MSNYLSEKYIEEHKLTIHDYESWGKALAEVVLTNALLQSGDGVENIKFEVPISITANTKGCITVCVWGVCVHVKA